MFRVLESDIPAQTYDLENDKENNKADERGDDKEDERGDDKEDEKEDDNDKRGDEVEDGSATYDDSATHDGSATYNGSALQGSNINDESALYKAVDNSVDGFSASIQETVEIIKLSDEEMEVVKTELSDLNNKLQSTKSDGVYKPILKLVIARARDVNRTYYEQTNNLFLSDMKEFICQYFLSEYYYYIDYELTKKNIGRYYTDKSVMKFSHTHDPIKGKAVIVESLMVSALNHCMSLSVDSSSY
jgi:hypothetical protein